MRSRHGRGDVAPCASFFLPLSPQREQVTQVPALGRQACSDLLVMAKGSRPVPMAGWSLSLGAAALGEFPMVTFPDSLQHLRPFLWLFKASCLPVPCSVSPGKPGPRVHDST